MASTKLRLNPHYHYKICNHRNHFAMIHHSSFEIGNSSKTTLSEGKLALMHRYWQAANYLSGAQIYLRANALLKETLQPDHIKPRLLGHWGTCPGINLIYTHLNRLIQDY